MNADTLWTLPSDVILQPVRDLDLRTRQLLGGDDSDFAVSRPGRRSTSVLVDAHTAGLLERFREPQQVVDAVLLYSLPRQLEAREFLNAALPLIDDFARKGFLVDASDPDADLALVQTFTPGDRVPDLDFEVRRLIRQVEDVEVYRVRFSHREAEQQPRHGALKLALPEAEQKVGSLALEGEILQHLDGQGVPKVFERGVLDERPYLLLEWCAGVDSEAAAQEWRRRGGVVEHNQLLSLAIHIAEAYAGLHQKRVLHGDVHPRNLLVDGEGQAKLIDFGAARWIGTPKHGDPRPGVAFYMEPEHARALLAGEPNLPLSPLGEQYAVATLLYRLFTGAATRDFQLERRAMMRQLVSEPVLSFEQRGIEPWPEVEQVLAQALASEPEARFASVADLATALRGIDAPRARAARSKPRLSGKLRRRVDALIASTGIDEDEIPALTSSPAASLAHGAAGIAAAFLTVASLREEAELLTRADLWARHAAKEAAKEGGFICEPLGLPRSRIGWISPYYAESGPFVVQAAIGRAQGHYGTYRMAVDGFAQTVESAISEGDAGAPEGLSHDLVLGHAGVLLHCALLSDGVPVDGRSQRLSDLGHQMFERLRQYLEVDRAISSTDALGMAHGWAGVIYSLLQWCRVSDAPVPPSIERRLDELARLVEPAGRGLFWPWRTTKGTSAGSMPGWCNGSAGFVFLFDFASRMLGEPSYDALANGAAWNSWEASATSPSLCCGQIGRAYALLARYRTTGDRVWLERAVALGDRVAGAEGFEEAVPHGFHKGDFGLVTLAAALEHPDDAALPFFEEERWPVDSEA